MNPLYQAMVEDMIMISEDGVFTDTNEDMIIGTIDDRLDGQQIVLHDEDEELDDDTDKITEEDMEYEFD